MKPAPTRRARCKTISLKNFGSPCRVYVLRLISDYDSPVSHFPSSYQALNDVWIVSGEIFGDGAIRAAEHQECFVSGVSECPGEDEFAAPVRFPDQAKVLLPKFGPAGHEIVDHIVENRIIVHSCPLS